ncbi:MAG: PEP-CTERM sorting domain-containing protein [Caldimonas sp.]
MLTISASASASIWGFDYGDGTSVEVDGTLTTSDVLTNGGYLVTSITGFRNGTDAIVGLATPPTYGTYGFDNLLLAGPGSLLDVGGILFTTASGGAFNICGASPAFTGYVCGSSGYTEFNAKTGVATGVTFTVQKLPEPTTYVLALAALGVMGLATRRRKVAVPERLSS